MSELRFALITSGILILSYFTAINVSSLDRVLAYVGSTGSTAISFILPGLFYYKISDPESNHHQRLTKEDDDAEYSTSSSSSSASVSDGDEEEGTPGPSGSGAGLGDSIASLRSHTGSVGSRLARKLKRKWRWDLEHLETGLLRKMALGLSIYGVIVMVVCLGMNVVLGHGGH